MNIYCNGDSFTSGTEILDDQLPGFPGYHLTGSHLAKDVDKDWKIKRIQKAIEKFESHDKFSLEEKKHAWPAQLEKIDKSLYALNGATSGSSITSMANRTLLDLLENKNVKWDKIFIQLTSPYRFEFYKSWYDYRYFMNENTAGWAEKHKNSNERKIMLEYIQYYKDEDYSIKYLYSMIGLRNAVKGITGLEPIWLVGMKIWKDQILNSVNENKKLKSLSMMQTMIFESNIENIEDDDIMENTQIKNNFYYMPGKHYELKCHQKFAEIIYNKHLK